MLTARQIGRLIAAGDVSWHGELRGDGLLLRLGAPLQPLVARKSDIVDLADQASIDRLYDAPIEEWHAFDLEVGRLVLCGVLDPLRLGPRHVGAIAGLSHLARVGLAVHISSPWVLPGWDGHLTLELLNSGPAPLRIYHGMPVGRLLLFTLDGRTASAAPHPFYSIGSHLGSRYAEEFPAQPGRR